MEHNNQGRREMMQDFKIRFYISLVLTLPMLVLSPMIQELFNYSFKFSGSNYLLFFFATLVFIYGGWPFLTGLYNEVTTKSLGMMTLIALAISVAYFYSSAVVFGLEGRLFFWELATLIDIMLAGHWIEMKSVISASKALEKLAQLMPDEAHLVQDGEIVDVKINQLSPGDVVLIKPGEKFPADGEVVEGTSYINQSMLTGESEPVKKEEGEQIIGGSINGDSSIKVEITGAGEESYLSKVINLVEESQNSKSKTQNLADRAALWLTIIAITVGLSTLAGWLIAGSDLAFSIERMATVMVITCPHALGLAIPLVVSVSTTQSAKNGLLIRNRTAFENSRNISTIVFDKTGTLTEGEFGVSEIEVVDETFTIEKVIKTAASLEQHSEHPIAQGIINKADNLDLALKEVQDFAAIKGKGVVGTVDGKEVKVVSPAYLEENNIKLEEQYLANQGSNTVVVLLIEDEVKGLLTLADKIREESYQAVKKLKEAGIKTWMLTGDNEKTASNVASELGLDGYFAEVLPHEKQDKVQELQQEGEFVAMTGDGVNDAPALAQADVGIAIGSGTDVAAETADIILVDSNPEDVVTLIDFGKATYKKMIQNLIWATGYNAFAIPLAAGVFYWAGILISPAVGAVLMSLSTVIVAINAKMLKLETN
ncbi:MAG: copper-translocating P-type ATPase [Halanaerobacter sp.]